MESKRLESIFEPGKITIFPSVNYLIDLRREMKAVDDPGVVSLKLEKSYPGFVCFYRLSFFTLFEVDQAAAPGEIGEGAPFGGDDGGMIAVLSHANDLRMLVERKSYFGLESESGSLKNNLRAELDAHGSEWTENQAVAASADCRTL